MGSGQERERRPAATVLPVSVATGHQVSVIRLQARAVTAGTRGRAKRHQGWAGGLGGPSAPSPAAQASQPWGIHSEVEPGSPGAAKPGEGHVRRSIVLSLSFILLSVALAACGNTPKGGGPGGPMPNCAPEDLQIPVMVSPADGANIEIAGLTFDWVYNPTDCLPEEFEIQVSQSPGFESYSGASLDVGEELLVTGGGVAAGDGVLLAHAGHRHGRPRVVGPHVDVLHRARLRRRVPCGPPAVLPGWLHVRVRHAFLPVGLSGCDLRPTRVPPAGLDQRGLLHAGARSDAGLAGETRATGVRAHQLRHVPLARGSVQRGGGWALLGLTHLLDEPRRGVHRHLHGGTAGGAAARSLRRPMPTSAWRPPKGSSPACSSGGIRRPVCLRGLASTFRPRPTSAARAWAEAFTRSP